LDPKHLDKTRFTLWLKSRRLRIKPRKSIVLSCEQVPGALQPSEFIGEFVQADGRPAVYAPPLPAETAEGPQASRRPGACSRRVGIKNRVAESNGARKGQFMEKATQSSAEILSLGAPAKGESGLFSIESVLNLQKLIFAGSPLSEVLTHIAQLVESQAQGMLCTIWLPDEDGKELHCAAAPSLPGFSAHVGTMAVRQKGASCGTAVYRRESVYVTDILIDPLWEDYRDRLLPYGIRSVWSRPLFTSEGKALGTFSLN